MANTGIFPISSCGQRSGSRAPHPSGAISTPGSVHYTSLPCSRGSVRIEVHKVEDFETRGWVIEMDDRIPKERQSSSQRARIEAREQTTRVAMQMLEEERRLRALKTERLRQARLEAQMKGNSPS